jgi:hypothetical protein
VADRVVTDVVYLYGFVPAGVDAPAAGVAGIADRPVELVDVADFQAAMSFVPAEAYRPDVIEQQLEDLRWVAEQGLAHERVVAWFVDRARIVPVPLLTLYTTPAALAAAAAPRAATIGAQLRRFEGLREWDLKVSYRARDLSAHAGELSEEVRALDAGIASAAPGRRFLLEKKRSDLVKERVGAIARERAGALLDELRGRARDAVVLPIPRADHELPVVLHAALLVEARAEAALTDEVARRAAQLDTLGLSVQFSGPWAPYRFLDRDEC